jgi:biopolymer transport protein TolR
MAFHFGAGDDDSPLGEINVTPLVDVMLVLLIIFMVTAPMLHQGIEVALPKADAANLPPRVDDPLIVSINRDGLVFLRDTPIHPTQLVERLTPMLKARGDDSIFLKGDRDVPYGRVMELLDILHRGGIEHVGMVTERTSPKAARVGVR